MAHKRTESSSSSTVMGLYDRHFLSCRTYLFCLVTMVTTVTNFPVFKFSLSVQLILALQLLYLIEINVNMQNSLTEASGCDDEILASQ